MLEPAALLARCNEFRRAGGAEELEALQPGIAKKARFCLIAKNLNFECSIAPFAPSSLVATKTRWFIYSDDIRLVSVASILGLDPVSAYREGFYLPEDLADSAKAFDEWRYPEQLYMPLHLLP